MRFLFFFVTVLSFTISAFAVPSSEDYIIKIREEIPNIPALKDKYDEQKSEYSRHFSFRWDMPQKFDENFKGIYQGLALDERHLSTKTEDHIYKMLMAIPKETYPYIGPYLHTLPQLSGRILEMPGIKETKNKFPERIAEKYKDIENIEYLSPALYIYLMPEMVGEGDYSFEYAQFAVPEYRTLKRLSINPEFLQKIAAETPISDYIGNKPKEMPVGIRHYIADETTKLSGADVKALSNTFGDLHDFNIKNRVDLISTNYLISYWEEQNGTPKGFYYYKQIANPCAAMVRNIRWTGRAAEFQTIIGKNGFGLDDWALICDKTLKAYRRANISLAMMMEIRGLKSGALMRYYETSSGMDEDSLRELSYLLGASMEMYNATKEDVKAVKPYIKILHDTIPETSSFFLGAPLIIP